MPSRHSPIGLLSLSPNPQLIKPLKNQDIVPFAPLAVTVSLPNLTATPGPITIPITVGDLTNQGVISYDMQITYDAAVLTPASPPFDVSGTMSSNSTITPNTNFAGHLILSGFQTATFAGSGTLINLKFNVIGAQGQSSAVQFQNYNDPQGNFHFGFRFNEGSPSA